MFGKKAFRKKGCEQNSLKLKSSLKEDSRRIFTLGRHIHTVKDRCLAVNILNPAANCEFVKVIADATAIFLETGFKF